MINNLLIFEVCNRTPVDEIPWREAQRRTNPILRVLRKRFWIFCDHNMAETSFQIVSSPCNIHDAADDEITWQRFHRNAREYASVFASIINLRFRSSRHTPTTPWQRVELVSSISARTVLSIGRLRNLSCSWPAPAKTSHHHVEYWPRKEITDHRRPVNGEKLEVIFFLFYSPVKEKVCTMNERKKLWLAD